jgi:hypothetical protein
MARRSASEKLLDLIETDPRFLLAGPAASMIFIRLVRLMARLGDASVLRLGFVFGSWNEVAFGLRITETELETHLQTLAQRGIIERDEGSLTLPEWIGLRDRRAEAARENGKKGGRPRKNAPVPGQGWMPLPIAGWASTTQAEETRETEYETQSETLSQARLLSLKNQTSEEREENDVLVLLKELVELGALHPKEAGNREVASGWLQRGATLPALRQAFLAATRRSRAPRLAPIGYFTRIVEDLLAQSMALPALNERTVPPEDPTVAALKAESDAMWARYRDTEGATGPCPPPRGRWLAGEVEDAHLWRAYITEGRAVFQRAA